MILDGIDCAIEGKKGKKGGKKKEEPLFGVPVVLGDVYGRKKNPFPFHSVDFCMVSGEFMEMNIIFNVHL